MQKKQLISYPKSSKGFFLEDGFHNLQSAKIVSLENLKISKPPLFYCSDGTLNC